MNKYYTILLQLLRQLKPILKVVKKYGFIIISLLATPILIFISTSAPIYLNNQSDLGYQLHVLLPFLWLSIGTVITGLVFWFFSDSRFGRIFLWSYYIIGPLFTVFTFLRETPLLLLENTLGIIIFMILSLGLIIVIAYFKSPRQVLSYFAILSALLLASEIYRFGVGVDWSRYSVSEEQSIALSTESSNKETLPNIYHIIFDGFQSDVFEHILTPELRKELGGFVYFPETTTLYSTTTWSVPSVFLGKTYTFSNSQLDYQDRAFNSDESVLYNLKEAGYYTLAYTRNIYSTNLKLFDRVIEHVDNIGSKHVDNTNAFISAWTYRYAPLALKNILADRNILNRDALEQFNIGTFLPASAPEESFLSFQQFLIQEKELADSGRYTFIHVLFPHNPYVFDADCVAKKEDATVNTQSQCATKLMINFINELKTLGRYENSSIIIHADHGDQYIAVDGNLVQQDPSYRSPRSLLLVKPSEANDRSELEVSSFESTLLDIAPTLLASAGISDSKEYEGVSLIGSDIAASNHRDRYYFIVVGGKDMKKYLIDGDEEVFEESLALENLSALSSSIKEVVPIFNTNEVIEAEAGYLSSSHVGSDIPDTQGSYVRTGGGLLGYQFRVEQDGIYNLRARLITPSGNNDSVKLIMDDGKRQAWKMGRSNLWKWHESSIEWNLKSGLHLLTLENREQIWIDQIGLYKTKK
ncbi:MAG: sulfatase-like hydrolase/transferase [Candidatus Moranbacteria bacterium]|jgi:hypothetical protein|nr:sulfatase-like hydrolase/transferase [Candidatus Moranbacteria bacterium]